MAEILDKIRKTLLFVTEYFSDAVSYFRYCGISPFQDPNRKLFYKILIEAHALEKGLSMAQPRPLFGVSKIRFLISALDRYDISFSRLPGEMVCGVFQAYLELHQSLGVSDPLLDEVRTFLTRYKRTWKITPNGGVRQLDRDDYHQIPDAARLLTSRHSTRMFLPELLQLGEVELIVHIAQSAPSQCNRQSAKAYFYQERADIDRLLRLQAGSAGFAQDVNNLFVITSELAAWGGAQQRNQAYVDGALFAMNLMLACHASGIASCPLNLAVTYRIGRAICEAGGIGKGERLVMMIAVGRPVSRDRLRIARSPRRPLHEVLVTKLVGDHQEPR